MTPFDPIHSPLEGISLIEAAAGTGKTHAIESLYLRLVLEKQLPVEQILVVTFTRAATSELRDRIYRRLAKARDVFSGAAAEGDVLLHHLTAPAFQRIPADRLLRQALMDFDRAAIFTIHGFCQRVLYENAFETANAFDAELLRDQTPILVEVVEDFWRRTVCDQPAEFLRFAQGFLGEPSRLLELARQSITADFAVIPRRETPCLQPETLAVLRTRREHLRAVWSAGREDVRGILLAAPLNGKSYGTQKPSEKGAPTGRAQRVEGLLAALDAYLAQESSSYPPPQAAAKLAASSLARATLKGRVTASHPVFDACEALQQAAELLALEMNGHLQHLKWRLVSSVPPELERRLLQKGRVSFDDLLRRVARTLEGLRGDELTGAVRRRYRAALVDEFQDTDDLQYRVFARLFASPQHLLVMIGDPKQAIYGFRGADIFSYLRAARRADARFTLFRNWRSSPGLVQAVNTLFTQSTAPFLFPGIAFTPGKAARVDAAVDAPAMVFWHLDSRRQRDDGKALTKKEAQTLCVRAVTAEIGRLLFGRTPAIPAGDMAVLVRTNSQASLMKAHLSAAGVPSVIYSTANVFDSDEARELLAVLFSVAEPQNSFRLKSALATRLLGATAADIAAGERSGEAWARRIRRHWEYLRLWTERGFTAMFRQWLAGEAVKQRLLELPGGERRLTNLLHLGELAHRATENENLGAAGLLKWLGRQADPDAQRCEETQLRLESDDLAVKIVTVHRSKGLEYPIVFCPFGWSGSTLRGGDVFFHDVRNDDRLTVDLSGDRDSPNRLRAQNEILAENLRMLYVAVTRARERCYLVWGRINTAESSALSYLLCSGAAAEDRAAESDWISRLKDGFSRLGDDETRRRLDQLAACSGGTIAVRPLPEQPPPAVDPGRPLPEMVCREFQGAIDSTWSLTSYSALASAAGVDAPDHDAGDPASADEAPSEDAPPAPAVELADFPAGARAGTLIHSVFEALDFARPDPRAIVSRKLKEFGFSPHWQEPLCRMIAAVLAAPLFGDPAPVRLADVGSDRRVTEMEFYVPLKRVTPAALEEALAGHGGALPPDGKRTGAFGERLHFAPTRGFLKGFIDLVFAHRGRYYLIDWKSNRLGAAPADYHRSRLDRVMHEHLYDLQYHLYTLALHLYLRRRVAGYDYDRDFGGVCYVFVRGVDLGRGPEYGLFCDRPEPRRIHALGAALIPDYA